MIMALIRIDYLLSNAYPQPQSQSTFLRNIIRYFVPFMTFFDGNKCPYRSDVVKPYNLQLFTKHGRF